MLKYRAIVTTRNISVWSFSETLVIKFVRELTTFQVLIELSQKKQEKMVRNVQFKCWTSYKIRQRIISEYRL